MARPAPPSIRARPSVIRRGLGRAADLFTSRPARALLLCLGVLQVGKQVWLLTPPRLYEKDFRQDYSLARALVEGAPLYDPLVEMVRKYVGSDLMPLPSPSPHPPGVAVVLVPLATLPYPAAAATWVAVSLALLLWSLRTVARGLGWRPSGGDLLLLLSCVLLWPPVMADLRFGQLTIALLACIVASWSAMRSGRPHAAGFFLGVGASVKLFPGFLVLWLVCKRRWRTAAVAAAVFTAISLVPELRLGGWVWLDYLLRVVPTVADTYHDWVYNFSLYGLVHNLTAGHSYARALVAAPALPLVLVGDALVVLASLGLSLRYGDWSKREVYDLDWSLMIIAMLLLSPLTWLMSLVLLLLPMAVFVRGFMQRGSPTGPLGIRHVLIFLGMSAPVEGFRMALQGSGDAGPLSSGPALVLSIPNLALIVAFGIACSTLIRAGARRAR